MGMHLNPSNCAFASVVSDFYVDKTGLIWLVNDAVDTPQKFLCVTRPRRFGKTFAASALIAYYSCGCDSSSLFDDLEIANCENYRLHLNSYNVIALDVTGFWGAADLPASVSHAILNEVRSVVPGASSSGHAWEDELVDALIDLVRTTNRKIIFVIDEWDAPFREGRDDAAKESWVQFLGFLFENSSFVKEAIAAVYMTGILPISCYGANQSLPSFTEYTMLNPGAFAPYVGFTECEVESVAAHFRMPIEDFRRWYDGYTLPDVGKVYAPYSVMETCERGHFYPYWAASETLDSLRRYIDLDFDSLQQDVIQMLGGADVPFRPSRLQNDLFALANTDDVLAVLVHLGYLAYDYESGTVRVPNAEVASQLRSAVKGSRHSEVANIVCKSDDLLAATWDKESDAVARAIERVHNGFTAPLFYDDEHALRAVVKAAYISAVDHYASVDELPGGHGYANIAFIPKQGSFMPAMLAELKWDKAPEAAIAQVRERKYPEALAALDAPLLLVCIQYDSKTKVHDCTIEELERISKEQPL